MTVTVLLFASYADAFGASSIDIELASKATVADLLDAIRLRPGSERLPRHPVVAVNQRYANVDGVVRAGDEIALIPPVAGG
jgi:molybdopterin converting factor subunit 1